MVHEDYLPCSAYENQPAHATEAGFCAFYDEASQRYFFATLDADGKVLLKSEGYPQLAARENGIQSVIKNRVNRDYYSVKEDGGKYYLSLRAANYREIARSCSVDTEAEALALIDYASGAKIRKAAPAAMAAAPTQSESERVEDNYLACREYQNHGAADANGMTKWQKEGGENYFTWLNNDGSVKMRSEGYPTAGARDNGYNSVLKNRELKERYSIKEVAGRYFVILKAGNHQEIARSCPYNSMAAVMADFTILAEAAPAEEAPAAVAPIAAAATALAAGAQAIDAPDAEPEVDVEDDYMTCKDYHGHTTAPRDGFRTFKSERTGKYYFAVVDSDGDVSFRSEGHLTEADRDADMADVVRNMFKKENYAVKQIGMKHYFIVLSNENGKEIARSCLYDDMAAVYAAAPFLKPAEPAATREIPAAPIAAAAVAAVTAAIPDAPKADVEDDYLTCAEYKGHTHSPHTRKGFVTFKSERTGKYYFALQNEDGDVLLRGEGHPTEKERDDDLWEAIHYYEHPENYEVKKIGMTHYFRILKDKNGKEIARSCPYREAPPVYIPAVAPVAAVAATAAAAAPIIPPVAAAVPEVAAATGGFKWWWLLLPLLALLGWWLSRGCNKAEVAKPAVTEVPKAAPAVLDTVKTETAAPVPAPPSCDLNWIFFDFDKDAIRPDAETELATMAKILKDNPDYVGVLSAHTDAKGSTAYNDDLSRRRAGSAKKYLVGLGIAANRLTTEADSENAPIATNTEDDAGRHFNRRVELYVRDKAGKDICKSIPPAVPSNLKQ
jgi:outer membrane protein OmpA-like peptidoglycan-associated protein/uncharacterized protein YegP (UPF0339 family)